MIVRQCGISAKRAWKYQKCIWATSLLQIQGPILKNFTNKFREFRDFENLNFSLVGHWPFWTFFPKKNVSFLWKSVKSSWISRMEQNFDNYTDFQPQITHLKHFSRQCISFFLEAQIVRKFWQGLFPDYFFKNADVCIPETPPPLMSANVCNWVPPPPLKVADVLCGRPLSKKRKRHKPLFLYKIGKKTEMEIFAFCVIAFEPFINKTC